MLSAVQPARCVRAISEYRREVNPARAFLLDNYTDGLEYEGLPSMEVYQAYVHWCENNGYHPMNNTNFGKELRRVMPLVKRNQKRVGRRRMVVYEGLGVREGSEVATETMQVCQQCL